MIFFINFLKIIYLIKPNIIKSPNLDYKQKNKYIY